jgi:hypothetical protein
MATSSNETMKEEQKIVRIVLLLKKEAVSEIML